MNKIERRGSPEGASTTGSTLRYPYPPCTPSSECLASAESAAQVVEGWVMAVWASRRRTNDSRGDGNGCCRALGVADEKTKGAYLPEALAPPASLIAVRVPRFPRSLHFLRPSHSLALDIAGARGDVAAIRRWVRQLQLAGRCASTGLAKEWGREMMVEVKRER